MPASTTSRPYLNLIGPGRLGRTLARLWRDAQTLEIGGIVGRSRANAEAAVDFIGAGQIVDWANLAPAAFTLIATPDDCIDDSVTALAASGILRQGDVVFHCSGALPSERLAPLRAQGAQIASIHPIKTFARPEDAANHFAGTVCGCEGGAGALAALAPHFDAIGAIRMQIDPARKLLYHAGAVLACNHLVALMEAALACMEAAGLPRNNAWSALQPLIGATLANIGNTNTREALTGPVRRGDRDIVLAEIAATSELDRNISEAYRALSRIALKLCPPGNPITREDLAANPHQPQTE
ncbi:MAG: DUF2520 domain-containing protein [Betaproteobacteria bacterium]|nr:DUF2520 domain-containing protein [Betaproteobacteria bacterium]